MVVLKASLSKIFIPFTVLGGLKYLDNFSMIALLREKSDGFTAVSLYPGIPSCKNISQLCHLAFEAEMKER